MKARTTRSIVVTGKWGLSSTWDNGLPICGDTIVISAGNIISLFTSVDFSSPSCSTPMFLVVEGTFSLKTGTRLNLPCNSGLLVKAGGKIESSGGSGSSCEIYICGTIVWQNGDGPITTPTSFGVPYSVNIKSVTSGRWGISSTWDCNCVPTFYNSPTIDSLHTVTISLSTKILNLTINGTLDATTLTDTIHLLGNWISNGTFINGSSTVNFNGTTSQIISGNSSFYNLKIINSAGVSNIGNIDLYHTLTLTLGNFSTNNALTLISNTAGTANIASITGGSISGNITMQRYIDAGATNWRFITTPTAGATLAQLNDDFITSGFTGSDFPFWPTALNPWSSIYFYDESVIGIQDSGYVAATNVSNTINTGQGLWVWCGDTITGTQPFTIDFNGVPNKGNINLPITYTNTGSASDDGWNMAGNPYPSSIDWDSPSITKSGINNAIYIWNPDMEQFASYVGGGIGTNGGSRYVASTQAFWVQANSAGASVQMTESSKSNVDASFLKNNYSLPLLFNVQNSYGTDQTIINFNNSATNGFDAAFDAAKLGSTNPNLPYICSVLDNGQDLSINQLPEQEIVIPIKILAGVSGIHTISVENIDEYTVLNCMYLEDVFTGMTYNLFNQQTITAYIYDTTTVARYLLHIGTKTSVHIINPSCSNITDGQISIENNSLTGFATNWMDGQENLIVNHINSMNIDSLQNLEEGTYIIETNDLSCGTRRDTVSILEPDSIFVDFNYTNTGLDITFNNQSANGITYLWDFGNGDTSTVANPQYTYPNEGTYLVVLTVYQNDSCFTSYSEWITILATAVAEQLQENTNAWINGENLQLFNSNHYYDSYRIVDLLGKTIAQMDFNQNYHIKHNLKGIRPQILFVTFVKGTESRTFKIPYISNN